MKYLFTLSLALFLCLGPLSAQLSESDGYRVEDTMVKLTNRYHLTQDQVDQIRIIVENYAPQKADMMTQSDLPERKKQIRTYQRNMNREILDLLNKNQKKLFVKDRKREMMRKKRALKRRKNKSTK